MTLATADADGVPWASPVWFASEDGETFFWVSDPNARHSRNIAARTEVAIVIFDSTVVPGDARAVYIEARATLTDGTGLDVFNRAGEAQGLAAWPPERIAAPAKHRLYRATAVQRWTLDANDERLPLTSP
jgi:hypothetical protein